MDEIYAILERQPEGDPFNLRASELWKNDRHEYYQTAREWTRKHAMNMEIV